MRISRLILCITFMLFASTALAAKPDKTLVCHVGSQPGSMGETYKDNPDCTIAPEWVGDPADYICPDAGKVDLILVSKKAKHIGNPSHSFEDDTGYPWEDYSPEDGIGDDPLDFEEGDVLGIDRGCELAEENLSCPCWNSYTFTSLVARFQEAKNGPLFCIHTHTNDTVGDEINISSTYLPRQQYWMLLRTQYVPDDPYYPTPNCRFRDQDYLSGSSYDDLEPDEYQRCHDEAVAIFSQIAECL